VLGDAPGVMAAPRLRVRACELLDLLSIVRHRPPHDPSPRPRRGQRPPARVFANAPERQARQLDREMSAADSHGR
jgi:hypothetical protein